MFDHLRRHLDNPVAQHLKQFLSDIIGTLEDMQNDSERRVVETCSKVLDDFQQRLSERLENTMSALTDQLSAAISDLGARITDHDAAVQAALSKLLTTVTDSTDTTATIAAVTAAVDAIGGASSKIAAETKALTDAMAKAIPTAQQPGVPADPAVAAAAAPVA